MARARKAEPVLVRVSERGTLTLPAKLRARAPKANMMEVVLREDGVYELRPRVTIDAVRAWFWTEEWQAKEREADEDIAAGRVRTYNSAEEFIASLEARLNPDE